MRTLRRLGALLLLAVTFFAVGCSAPAPSAKFVAQAERLHEGALASAVTTNADLRDYVQLICDRLGKAALEAVPNRANESLVQNLRCHLVNSPVINAFYTGGNHIYLYVPLLQTCENEDELAAAIAHEYAHAINLDVEKTKLRPDPNLPLPRVAWGFVINRFTLNQESAADDLAFLIYTRGGWDPARFPQLFERLAATTPSYAASDRMPLAVRASRIRGSGTDTPRAWRKPPVADPRTFESLRRQAGSQGQGAGNAEGQLFLLAFPNCMLSGDPPATLAAQNRLRPPPPPPARLEPS